MNGLALKKVRVLWVNFTGYINWKRGIVEPEALEFGFHHSYIWDPNTLLPTTILHTLLGPKYPLETSEQRKQNPVDILLKYWLGNMDPYFMACEIVQEYNWVV